MSLFPATSHIHQSARAKVQKCKGKVHVQQKCICKVHVQVHVQKGSACAIAPEVQSKVHVQVNVQRKMHVEQEVHVMCKVVGIRTYKKEVHRQKESEGHMQSPRDARANAERHEGGTDSSVEHKAQNTAWPSRVQSKRIYTTLCD